MGHIALMCLARNIQHFYSSARRQHLELMNSCQSPSIALIPCVVPSLALWGVFGSSPMVGREHIEGINQHFLHDRGVALLSWFHSRDLSCISFNIQGFCECWRKVLAERKCINPVVSNERHSFETPIFGTVTVSGVALQFVTLSEGLKCVILLTYSHYHPKSVLKFYIKNLSVLLFYVFNKMIFMPYLYHKHSFPESHWRYILPDQIYLFSQHSSYVHT